MKTPFCPSVAINGQQYEEKDDSFLCGTLCLFVRLHAAYAIEGIECTRIADEGEVTGNDSDEQIFVVTYVVVAGNMSFQLRLATTLGSKETERNELAHLQVNSRAGVVIAKAVVCQPFVDMSAVLRP